MATCRLCMERHQVNVNLFETEYPTIIYDLFTIDVRNDNFKEIAVLGLPD